MERAMIRSALAIVLILTLAGLTPGVAAAQSVRDQVVSQLRDYGYERIEVTETLLGRIRIVAQSASRRREIIVNPATGAILRDYTRTLDRDGRPRVTLPRTGDDDDRWDDNDDDRDDDSEDDDSGSDDSGGDDDDDDSGDDDDGDDDD